MYLQQEISKKYKGKKIFWDLEDQVVAKRAGPGSVRQLYGSADRDSYQNVTHPQHWLKQGKKITTILQNGKSVNLEAFSTICRCNYLSCMIL
jgi:hypothetical protein